MDIRIKKITPELTKDYIDFFENVAFTDNPEWEGCYCVYYHWDENLDAKRKEYELAGGSCFKRELAMQFIQEGVLQGYLAYQNETVVGWCNVNNKSHYTKLRKENRPELWEDIDNDKKVKSIVCYTIAPNMRRKGIATQLLNQLCCDAAEEGYDCVEAYPNTGVTTSHSYHGPLALYEKSGFIKCKDIKGEVIVRKYL